MLNIVKGMYHPIHVSDTLRVNFRLDIEQSGPYALMAELMPGKLQMTPCNCNVPLQS